MLVYQWVTKDAFKTPLKTLRLFRLCLEFCARSRTKGAVKSLNPPNCLVLLDTK